MLMLYGLNHLFCCYYQNDAKMICHFELGMFVSHDSHLFVSHSHSKKLHFLAKDYFTENF